MSTWATWDGFKPQSVPSNCFIGSFNFCRAIPFLATPFPVCRRIHFLPPNSLFISYRFCLTFNQNMKITPWGISQ